MVRGAGKDHADQRQPCRETPMTTRNAGQVPTQIGPAPPFALGDVTSHPHIRTLILGSDVVSSQMGVTGPSVVG